MIGGNGTPDKHNDQKPSSLQMRTVDRSNNARRGHKGGVRPESQPVGITL
jgi:hypothetical protein